jgi:hypothetical protein
MFFDDFYGILRKPNPDFLEFPGCCGISNIEQ